MLGAGRKLISATLFAVLVLLALPQGQASAAQSKTLSFDQEQAPAAVRGFWTSQRIRTAGPLSFSADDFASSTTARDAAGSPLALAPTSPTSGSAARAGSIPFVSHEVAAPSEAPFRTNGVILGVGANGRRYACSGTVVTSTNRSVVWTAGHCVFNRELGGWSRSIEFIPGYDRGSAPYGEWPVTGGVVPTGWSQGYTSAYDMAALVVAPNPQGQRIEDVVGARGILTGQSPVQGFNAYGYPGTAPFDGEKQWVCESAYGYEDPFEPGTMAIGCDMTFGSSGGGWIVAETYLNSLISYAYDNEPDVIYGPYFGATAATLHQKASTMSNALDGTPNFGDDSVQAAPVAAPTRLVHAMTLTLHLKGHLIASGRMSAMDGYTACAGRAPIRIYIRERARWELVDRTSTHEAGGFRVRIPDVRGTYKAFSPRGSVDDLNHCAATTSSTRWNGR
ncbi:MAG: trypsin-like serine peptidase [Actinomycetota bacterium]